MLKTVSNNGKQFLSVVWIHSYFRVYSMNGNASFLKLLLRLPKATICPLELTFRFLLASIHVPIYKILKWTTDCSISRPLDFFSK